MINISESLRQNAQSTARIMTRDNISVAGIQQAEGLVLIKCDSGYVCPSNSVLQTKISLDGENYWICEGNIKRILKVTTNNDQAIQTLSIPIRDL